jgi:hypothetical protein
LNIKRNSLRTVLSVLQNQITAARDWLKIWQSALDDKIQDIAEAHNKLAQLKNIKNNSKDYQEIENIAEKKANDILNNRKVVVLAAVIAVLEGLRNHPDKQQLLIYDSFYPSNNNGAADTLTKMMSSSTAANPEKSYLLAMPLHHTEIMKIAEGLYDQLVKVAVNNTIYSLASTSTHQFR